MTPDAARALADAGAFAVLIFFAAVVLFAVYKVIRALWEDHLESDREDRKQRDDALEVARLATQASVDSAQASKDQAAAWNRMVDTWERKLRSEADRRRKSDGQ